MQSYIRWALTTPLLLLTVFCLNSYTHHSSIGIDHDVQTDSGVLNYYYRVNWTGYGSVFVGYGSRLVSAEQSLPLERFDPAGALFKPPQTRPEPKTLWNRLGFWSVSGAKPTPLWWVGVPAWLLVLGLLACLFGVWRSLREGLS